MQNFLVAFGVRLLCYLGLGPIRGADYQCRGFANDGRLPLRGLLSVDSRLSWVCEEFVQDDKHLMVSSM